MNTTHNTTDLPIVTTGTFFQVSAQDSELPKARLAIGSSACGESVSPFPPQTPGSQASSV